MTSPDSKITFPHEELTKIEGKPTNTSLQLLQRQLYTNARSIASPRGGGLNGHLALLMEDAAYLARAGVAFNVPVHPGPAPVHAADATAAQIAETIRLYNQALAELNLFHNVSTRLKAQILAVVDDTFLQSLEDNDFGYADVTPRDMLLHLQANYAILAPEELEANRASLSDHWNPDEPLEQLWTKMTNISRIATAGGSPITAVAAITLTLAMFEKSGLLATTTEKFRLRPLQEWTMDNFQQDFTLANKERLRKLTAGAAGFHGAHAATPPPAAVPTAATVTPPVQIPSVTVDGGKMYYCWTHGLGRNQLHTSQTCNRKATGHIDNATAFNMQGGNDKIMPGFPPRNLQASTRR